MNLPFGGSQLTSAGGTALGYDLRGNLTSSGTLSYGYTAENRMVSGPAGATLSYDPAGRLYQTSEAGGTRLFYDGTDLSCTAGVQGQIALQSASLTSRTRSSN